MILVNVNHAQAFEITAGATTWYSWWDMEPEDSPDKFEYTPAFLYGPALSVRINGDFSLNTVFLYGEYDGDYKVYYDSFGEWVTFPSKTVRYDSDTSLTYRLNSYLRLFGGFKIAGYKFSVDEYPAYYLPAIEVKNRAYGPAAGLSGVFPAGNNLFLLANGSIIYMLGKSENSVKGKSDIRCPGYNISGSMAYYISSASVTISIGGRYQYLNWDAIDNNGTDADHNFYGITAAATYSFEL